MFKRTRPSLHSPTISISQGSVLGPLLFNIFINDLFFMKLNSEIRNIADDSTLYSCGKYLNEIVTNLEIDLCRLFKLSAENGMVANPKKFQLMFLGLTRHRRLRHKIEGNKVSATDCVKLLGFEIDNKLKFDKHGKTLYSKANMKINVFSRLNTYISREQASSICNAVLLSNFNYCPLIWLFCNKGASKEINRTHKRVLPMFYEDYACPFEILLTCSGSVCFHAENLQKLMMEIYKSKDHLSPSPVWEFHEKKCEEYNLRTKNLCKLPTFKSTSFGLESQSFRGSFLWNTLDDSTKNEPTLLAFKIRLRCGQEKNAHAGSAADFLLCLFVYDILYIVLLFFGIVNSWFKLVLSYYCKYQF